MDVLRNASPDFTVMKEPRGFLRVIQFVLSIFAFATVCTAATSYINVKCEDNSSYTVNITYSYPFNMQDYDVLTPFCAKEQRSANPFGLLSYASAAQFFCFMGVMSFLLCIAYVIVYILFSSIFANDSKAATGDFVFSAVWTALWFIASTAWADKLNNMGRYLSPQQMIATTFDTEDYCKNDHVLACTAGDSGNNATLVVSVLFGYLNMLIWGAGLWFLFKETPWHKEQDGDMQQQFDQPAADPTPTPAATPGPYQSPDPGTNTVY